MAFARRSFLVGLIVLTSMVILVGFLPLSTPRTFLNQRRATMSIRAVSLAERDYSAKHPHNGYTCNLSELGEQGLVRLVASGTWSGYHFAMQCLQEPDQPVTSYTITAVPVSPGITGQYALCADQSGQVWYSKHGVVSDCLAMRKGVGRKYR